MVFLDTLVIFAGAEQKMAKHDGHQYSKMAFYVVDIYRR